MKRQRVRTNAVTGQLEHYYEEQGPSSASPASGLLPGPEIKAVARAPGDPRNRAVNALPGHGPRPRPQPPQPRDSGT